jgi:cell division septation protein DedD
MMNYSRAVVTAVAVSMALLAGCARDQGDWRAAQAADTTEAYEQFIGKHPTSALANQARDRIKELGEERAWQGAATADTLDAYQQFLAQYPTGKWSKEAAIRIENFAVNGMATGAPPGAAAGATSLPDAVAPDTVAPDTAAPVVAPRAAAVPNNTATGTYGVQLGAFSSSDRANKEWQRLASSYSGPLEGLAPRVVVGESSGKQVYRLQAAVMDEAQARAVCGALKQNGQGCIVVKP